MKKLLRGLCLILIFILMVSSMTGCFSILLSVAEDFVHGEADATPAPAEPSAGEPSVALPGRGADYAGMQYCRPDFEQLSAVIAEAYALLDSGNSESMLETYEAAKRLYTSASTQYALAEVKHNLDVTDEFYTNELTYLSEGMNSAITELTDLAVAILDSPYGSQAEARWGSDRAQELRVEAALSGCEIEEELIKEQELVMEYQRILTRFCAHIDGEEKTLDDIYSDETLSYEEYERQITAYYRALSQEVGPIYLELVELRNTMADKMGFDNYSDYAYACYGRDFTPEDAKALHTAVKKYAVPLFLKMNSDKDFLMSEEYSDYLYGQYFLPDTLLTFEQMAENFSPKLSEACSFMLEKGLYALGHDANNMEGGFTTYFDAYRSPFLYVDWMDSSYDVSTLIHEMGHFTNYYYLEEELFGAVDPLDLSEVDSQGLELLFFPYYEEFYGEAADAARRDKLSDFLYSLIGGCMEDEFQQYVYSHPDLGLEQMHIFYGKLLKEYGISELYVMPQEYWVCIPHTFQSPLYYISYAVSALPALELWELSRTDYDAACATYWQLLERSPMTSFLTALEESGLSDPFDEDLVGEICSCIERYVYGQELAAAA